MKRFLSRGDVFSRRSDGTTIAAQYGKLGISLKVANMVESHLEGLGKQQQKSGGMGPR